MRLVRTYNRAGALVSERVMSDAEAEAAFFEAVRARVRIVVIPEGQLPPDSLWDGWR